MWKSIILDVECIVCNKSLQKINHVPPKVPLKMRKITTRRSRTPNWSIDEKQFFLELIKERKEVIVTKNNNGPNHSEEKDVAWNEILRELVAKFGNKFSESSIKKVKTQWQNMKRIAREEISQSGLDAQKYTRQSLEVCNILELVKDGELKKNNENFNDTILSTNVEIKSETVDEEMIQPGCSGLNGFHSFGEDSQNIINDTNILTSSSSVTEQVSETIDQENIEINQENIEINQENSKIIQENTEINQENKDKSKKNVSIMTDMSIVDGFNINPFHKELQDYFKYSNTEKMLKLETLKEERQVVRAMREAAELNKITAEQKLKHVLWVKKCEMSFPLQIQSGINSSIFNSHVPSIYELLLF